MADINGALVTNQAFNIAITMSSKPLLVWINLLKLIRIKWANHIAVKSAILSYEAAINSWRFCNKIKIIHWHLKSTMLLNVYNISFEKPNTRCWMHHYSPPSVHWQKYIQKSHRIYIQNSGLFEWMMLTAQNTNINFNLFVLIQTDTWMQ